MKIVFVNARYAPNELGGAERTVRTLAEAHVARGHEATAISIAHDDRASSSALGGVTTHYVPLANVYRPWRERPGKLQRGVFQLLDAYNPLMGQRVGALLDQERPDLIQCGNLRDFSVSVWVEARRRRIPVVQMLHDYYLGCVNSSMFRGGENCARQCGACWTLTSPRRWLSNLPEAVISLSNRTLEKLEAVGLFTRVPHKTVIHGISNLEPAATRPPAENKLLSVGYFGRIDRTKGVETLLEAASLDPAAFLVVLGGTGEPSYLDELRRRFESARVEFAGYVSPKTLFAKVDILVVPSLWEEPLGRVIYEAYAHGVPVVVHRAGGMPEIVEPGRTGFVVSPRDADELYRVLVAFAASPVRERFSTACQEKYQEFTVENRYSEFSAVWKTALHSHRSRQGQPRVNVTQ